MPSPRFTPGNTYARGPHVRDASATRKICLVMAGSAVLAVVQTKRPAEWKGHIARRAETNEIPATSRWFRLGAYIRGTSRRLICMRVLSAHTCPVEASAAEARAIHQYKPMFCGGGVHIRELPEIDDETADYADFTRGVAAKFPGVVFPDKTLRDMYLVSRDAAARQGE